ncbi:DDE-type integrase/transposase/recombinase [Candidatus Woesearchaeota archaeon]|nr:DDE-type integrase/transposase/recombinase [Candidatus Woesearchaeota archaeon]
MRIWNSVEDVCRGLLTLKTQLRNFRKIYNIVIASERGFNHPIERLHNSIRERTKVMRGFHGSMLSASAIMKGYEIYYNFCRKHQVLNKYPYELATNLELGNNKGLDLIKLAKSKK